MIKLSPPTHSPFLTWPAGSLLIQGDLMTQTQRPTAAAFSLSVKETKDNHHSPIQVEMGH